jgi:predicted protein tyrosine phosphatase
MREPKQVHIWSKPQFNSALGKLGINDKNVHELPDVAFISINDTMGQWNQSWFDEDHDNVLRLWFDDVETDMDLWSPTNTIHVEAFNSYQAQDTLDFIKRNEKKKTFIVHCTAGISRSGAVGQFIADYFACDKEEFKRMNPHICPNGLVSRMLNNLVNGYAND